MITKSDEIKANQVVSDRCVTKNNVVHKRARKFLYYGRNVRNKKKKQISMTPEGKITHVLNRAKDIQLPITDVMWINRFINVKLRKEDIHILKTVKEKARNEKECDAVLEKILSRLYSHCIVSSVWDLFNDYALSADFIYLCKSLKIKLIDISAGKEWTNRENLPDEINEACIVYSLKRSNTDDTDFNGLFKFIRKNYNSELIASSLRLKARRGTVVGPAPYGLQIEKLFYGIGTEKYYGLHQEEAPIVVMIFDMFVKGSTFSQIRDFLNNKGIKARKKIPWSIRSIIRIIDNESCGGILIWGKEKTLQSRLAGKKIRIQQEPKNIVTIKIPQIVDKKTFNKARRMRSAQKSNAAKSYIKGIAKWRMSEGYDENTHKN